MELAEQFCLAASSCRKKSLDIVPWGHGIRGGGRGHDMGGLYINILAISDRDMIMIGTVIRPVK